MDDEAEDIQHDEEYHEDPQGSKRRKPHRNRENGTQSIRSHADGIKSRDQASDVGANQGIVCLDAPQGGKGIVVTQQVLTSPKLTNRRKSVGSHCVTHADANMKVVMLLLVVHTGSTRSLRTMVFVQSIGAHKNTPTRVY